MSISPPLASITQRDTDSDISAVTEIEPDIESERTYTIGELAREFELTTRAIRFYEDQELINPLRDGQKRIYSLRDRVRLKLVMRGKRLGFSIKEIKDMIDLYDAPDGERSQLQDFIARMQHRRAVLLEQRNDIEQVLAELDEAQTRCEDILSQQPHARSTK